MKSFEPGKTYYTRSICDWECIYAETIVSRTAKTIKTAKGKTFRVNVWNDTEQFKPNGSYSMCAVISADKVQS